MGNVPFQEASWFDLLHKFVSQVDKKSVLDETKFCVTEFLLQKVHVTNCGKTFQANSDIEKHIEKKHHMIWPDPG